MVLAQAGQTVGLDAFPFHIHWDVVALVALLVGGYVYGLTAVAKRHAPQGEPKVTRREIAWFTSGIVFLWVVRTWPVHDIGEGSLFTFHMVEHVALSLAVPPMLIKGTPWWLMRRFVLPIMPVIKFLTRPFIALALFNVTLAALHAPGVVRLMLESSLAHLWLHAALLVTAGLMWWPVIGPIPDTQKLEPIWAMGYLFLQSLVPTIPASFLTFASDTVYKVYDELPRLWGLDVMTDQLIAGILMKVGGGLVLWTVITVVWFKWWGEEEGAAEVAGPSLRPDGSALARGR